MLLLAGLGCRAALPILPRPLGTSLGSEPGHFPAAHTHTSTWRPGTHGRILGLQGHPPPHTSLPSLGDSSSSCHSPVCRTLLPSLLVQLSLAPTGQSPRVLRLSLYLFVLFLELTKPPKAPFSSVQFSSVQSLSRVRLFATPRIVAHQASLSITISQSSLRLTSIKSVMPSSHLILCCPLLLLPPIPPSIKVFSNQSTLPFTLGQMYSQHT